MRFELRKLADCPEFGSCHFYTLTKGMMISRLVLACSITPDRWEPEDLLLILGPLLPKEEKGLKDCLDQMTARKAAGFLLDPSFADEEQIAKLQDTCRKHHLAFGTAPSDSWSAMIQGFDRLIVSRTDAEIKPYDRILEEMQHRFYTVGTEALLDELSYWTGCQAALMAGQDTFVCSSMPVLDEAVFYPSCWHKELLKPSFSHVNLFTSSHSKQKILQAELYKNRQPFGVLCLIARGCRKGDETGFLFEPSDLALLNYAAVLCTGMDDYRRRSQKIEAAIECFWKGGAPEPGQLELFPPSGCAFVLLEQKTAAQTPRQHKCPEGKQDYLSYLLHHHFPKNLCYSFARDGSLRLFVSADDTEHFGKKLLAVLDRAGKHYRAGISRSYPVSQAAAAFSEARNAAHTAQLLESAERLCHYHDLGIYRLLNYPENSWPVNQMLGEMDELLNQMDQEKRDMLAMTVRVFVHCRFSYQKTADKLYTHVNTVRYWIKLIEDLWNVNLSSDESRLLFSVLAKLLPLWMKSGYYSGTMPKADETEK